MTHIFRTAITGGIGSGKSYVCRRLRQHGIEVYDCDAAAKRILATDATVAQQLCHAVGQPVVVDNILRKDILTRFILASDDNKQTVNGIVHPAVAADFLSSGLSWLESAILFEARFDRRITFDAIICVTAPVDIRISRIVSRDGISPPQAMQWISCQMPQEEMERQSDFVITNDGNSDVDQQIRHILNMIDERKKELSITNK